MKLYEYSSYDEYRHTQELANHRKQNVVWVRQDDIIFLADYIKARMTPKFGLCHGTRAGQEQQWFRECLNCEVLGTEISGTATKYPNTLHWDFHETKPEWIDAVDFVYTNALDHSYDPQKALNAWMQCTGLCLIEHTRWHGPKHVSATDPFGADLEDMPLLINGWGAGRYAVSEILEHRERTFLVIERIA